MALTQEKEASPKRAVIAVTGEEARDFLQGILTNSVLDVAPDRPVFAALLTPQGKILHTMFVHGAPDGGVLVDTAAEGADDLIRRLTLFRLRRKIGIERRADLSVMLGEGAPDPRDPRLPHRGFTEGGERADWDAYEAARIDAGIPEQVRDYGAEEIFPHDANLDLLRGVDMKKGCFIGQEVVSRMHRKGGVRKRMCRIAFDGPAPAYGTQITDGAGADLGAVRSTRGQIGLALVRVDRLAGAQNAVTAGAAALSIRTPE